MTAPTLVRPLPESAEPDHNTTEPRPAHTPAPASHRRTPKTRCDLGFSMLELLVGMVILGILGAIGYGVYTAFIRDARDTTLNQNIQTAAAEMQRVMSFNADASSAELTTELTNSTNFIWTEVDHTEAFLPSTDPEPDTIRFQMIDDGSVQHPTQTATSPARTSPAVPWLVDGVKGQAVRLALTNNEGEWRCALIILKPSPSDVKTAAGYTGATADASAAAKAAQMRGIWYDGGSGRSGTYAGLHDCSPVATDQGTAFTTSTRGLMDVELSGTDCSASGTAGDAQEHCLPADAQTWHIPATDAATPTASNVYLDATSSSMPGVRTLHRSVSDLDSNA